MNIFIFDIAFSEGMRHQSELDDDFILPYAPPWSARARRLSASSDSRSVAFSTSSSRSSSEMPSGRDDARSAIRSISENSPLLPLSLDWSSPSIFPKHRRRKFKTLRDRVQYQGLVEILCLNILLSFRNQISISFSGKNDET